MKLQKRKQKNGFVNLVTNPSSYIKALGWADGQQLALCPNIEKGTLTFIPINGK